MLDLEALLAQYHGKRLLVVCRGDPDPDFLGAFQAFDLLAKKYEVATGCISTERVACTQNREEIDWLGVTIPVYKPGKDLSSYDGYVVLDAHGVDRQLFKPLNGMPWAVLIDHHEHQTNGSNPLFKEVRTDVGSTCTVLGSYLLHRRMLRSKNKDHRRVATALAMGIRVDTNDFHLAQPADFRVMGALLKYCDQEALDKLSFQTLTEKDMDLIMKAWHQRVAYRSFAASGVGSLQWFNRVALARAADMLIEVKGINTAVVYGVIDDAVHGVVHTCDRSLRLKPFIERIFPTIREMGGSYGGRQGAGGFKIPISSLVKSRADGSKDSNPETWGIVEPFVRLRFYQALGLSSIPSSS